MALKTMLKYFNIQWLEIIQNEGIETTRDNILEKTLFDSDEQWRLCEIVFSIQVEFPVTTNQPGDSKYKHTSWPETGGAEYVCKSDFSVFLPDFLLVRFNPWKKL
jgi:hypothetical protein